MLGFTGCFLYAMESLLVLRKGGRVMWPSPSPFFAVPLLRCKHLSLPVVQSSFALFFLSSGALGRRN
jgi:hypothetical protein